ncbi:hypothetical protein [Actinoplanes derwentensis]|uniref:Uncharacterized protein n=1 Tax=Actinoplanes derwentensis TaxID=113562 RepID=A0A1H1ZMY3_9ACTN|nr:hypothetical protein [Actinoplanes derwentensis]SDT35161.1 hypothetical protein SAMN04489716_3409 [Actinoplanes derwentensis]
MTLKNSDMLRRTAEQVANCLAESGYAFVEEDKIDGLAATLETYLNVAGIPVNTGGTEESTALGILPEPNPRSEICVAGVP